MKEKLRQYIDGLFAKEQATRQTMELRDEILQNSLDRYDDAVARGKSPEEAYRIAVDGIGDFAPILHTDRARDSRRGMRVAAAVSLFVLSVIPPVIGGTVGGFGVLLGPSLMFVLAALGVGLLIGGERGNKKRRLTAFSVMLYIICVIPTILTSESGAVGQTIGVCLMFLLAAAATGCLILAVGAKRTPAPPDASPADAPQAAEPPSLARTTLTPLYWLIAVGLFVAGNCAGLWLYAWLVFPLFGALGDIVRGCVGIGRRERAARRIASGFLWLAVLIAFVYLTEQTGAWYATWLVFPIGGALSGVLGGIFDLIGG